MRRQIMLNWLIQQVINGLQNTQAIPVQLHGQCHQGEMKVARIKMMAGCEGGKHFAQNSIG